MSELARVYGGRFKGSFTHYVKKGAMRFTHWGITYVRMRRRDALGLPVYEREAQS